MKKIDDLEKAQLLFKLVRGKKNWGACYDRLEHFKRFQNLDNIIKELAKIGWITLTKKTKLKAISANPKFKKKIIEFIEDKMPYLKGELK
ncbi:MAG: hypothetical protein IB618_03050 [Candidatus Pacearchaeota archaeon]|nr:MAG: hypothetical protein IB618_03050 [Candidatus Pacearchaeota archaeon]